MFDRLKPVTRPGSGLAYRPFVDYYYASRPQCALHVLLDDSGTAVGTVGVECMPFEYDGRPLPIAFGTNFFGAVPAAGGYLYLRWLKSAPLSMVFGGSADTHRILHARNWTYYPGVRTYRLNWSYPTIDGEAPAHRVAKAVLRRTSARIDLHRRIEQLREPSVVAREEHEYHKEMIGIRSAFRFRLAPDLGYLRWRYALDLSFARYRVFTIWRGDDVAGYVVLRDRPDHIIVAHADGIDARTLAVGILKATDIVTRADITRRGVILTSSHPEMQHVFAAAGFKPRRRERPLAFGSSRAPVDVDPDTSSWLVNYDWADNSLRPPFDHGWRAAPVETTAP